MALDRGVAQIELRAKLDTLKRDLAEGDKLAGQHAVSTGNKYDTIASKAASLAGKTKLLSLGVAGGLVLAGKAASDLGETVSFTEVTFKSAADEMIAWGDTTLDSMGTAKESALDAANGFGGLFQTTGATAEESAKLSQQMVQLAVDMSSAKNVKLEDAVLALGSGLRGEAEPLRRFNVLLSDAAIQAFALENGIGRGNKELTEQEKVQARLGIIMEQTTDIQGDYARTADSAANSQRRAQEAAKEAAAELGQALTPVMARVAQVAAELVGWFAAMPTGMQNAVIAGAGLIAVMSPMATAVGASATALKFFTVAQTGAIVSMTGFQVAMGTAVTKLPTLIAGLKGLGLAFLGAGAAVKTSHFVMENASEAFDELGIKAPDSLQKVGDASEEAAAKIAGVSPTLIETVYASDQARFASAALAAQMEESKVPTEQLGDALDETKDKGQRFASLTKKEFSEWRDSTTENFDSVKDALDKLAEKHKVTADDILRAFNKAIRAQAEYGENWNKVVNRAGDDADTLLKYIQENFGVEAPQIVAALANANQREFNKIVRKWLEGERSAKELTRVVGRSLDEIKSGLKGTSNEGDEAADSVKRLYGALRNLENVSDVKVNIGADGFGMGFGAFGSRAMMAQQAIGAVPGHQYVGSAYRPGAITSYGNVSYHADASNPAQDIFGANLGRVFSWLEASFGSRLKELIYTPMGYSIKNGARVSPIAAADHYDHVHLADFGSIVRGPAMIAQGPITEAHIPLSGPGAGVLDVNVLNRFVCRLSRDPSTGQVLMELINDQINQRIA